MSKAFIFYLFIMMYPSPDASSQIDPLTHIKDMNWFFEDEFAGSTLTMYESQNHIWKAIRQIHGSGVPVIVTEIYDVKIIKGNILLTNGIDISSRDKLKEKVYKYDLEMNQLTNNEYAGKDLGQNVELYSWAGKDILTKLDFSKLKSISIGMNETYELLEIKNIQLK